MKILFLIVLIGCLYDFYNHLIEYKNNFEYENKAIFACLCLDVLSIVIVIISLLR